MFSAEMSPAVATAVATQLETEKGQPREELTIEADTRIVEVREYSLPGASEAMEVRYTLDSEGMVRMEFSLGGGKWTAFPVPPETPKTLEGIFSELCGSAKNIGASAYNEKGELLLFKP
jgi:hypothetical protein